MNNDEYKSHMYYTVLFSIHSRTADDRAVVYTDALSSLLSFMQSTAYIS